MHGTPITIAIGPLIVKKCYLIAGESATMLHLVKMEIRLTFVKLKNGQVNKWLLQMAT